MKIVNCNRDQDQSSLHHELEAVMRLKTHKNIIYFYHAWLEKNDVQGEDKESKKMYILMEYCPCKSLRFAIDSDQVKNLHYKIWLILCGLLRGLEFIHMKGYIHRDIKPVM